MVWLHVIQITSYYCYQFFFIIIIVTNLKLWIILYEINKQIIYRWYVFVHSIVYVHNLDPGSNFSFSIFNLLYLKYSKNVLNFIGLYNLKFWTKKSSSM